MTKVEELISEGNQFSFDNNKEFSQGEFYSAVSPDFLAWFSKVEDFICTNYDESSGPYRAILRINQKKFIGYYQSEFEAELTKIKGAIISCKSVVPIKKSGKNNSRVMKVLSNAAFLSVLLFAIGAAYQLGSDNGKTKFDSEKIELEKENTQYKDSVNVLRRKINFLQLKIAKEVQAQKKDSIVNSN